MWDDDTDDDDSVIQHSCALIAQAAAFAGRRRIARRRCSGRRGGPHDGENTALFLIFTLGLGQIIFAAPIECSTDHSGELMTS